MSVVVEADTTLRVLRRSLEIARFRYPEHAATFACTLRSNVEIRNMQGHLLWDSTETPMEPALVLEIMFMRLEHIAVGVRRT
jgi:hypothetical protein